VVGEAGWLKEIVTLRNGTSELIIPYRVGGRGGRMISGNWYFEEWNELNMELRNESRDASYF
jgi:hypothetical protein